MPRKRLANSSRSCPKCSSPSRRCCATNIRTSIARSRSSTGRIPRHAFDERGAIESEVFLIDRGVPILLSDLSFPISDPDPRMNISLVGSRYFGATVFGALRDDGATIVQVVAPAADDRLAVAAQAAGVPVHILENPRVVPGDAIAEGTGLII